MRIGTERKLKSDQVDRWPEKVGTVLGALFVTIVFALVLWPLLRHLLGNF